MIQPVYKTFKQHNKAPKFVWKRLVRTFFPKPSSAVVWRKTTTILRLPYVVNYYCLMSWSRDDFLIFRLVIWRVFFSSFWRAAESITYVKFRYSEKAPKFWKKSPTLLWQYKVISNQDIFQIFWPSHNIWTLHMW